MDGGWMWQDGKRIYTPSYTNQEEKMLPLQVTWITRIIINLNVRKGNEDGDGYIWFSLEASPSSLSMKSGKLNIFHQNAFNFGKSWLTN